MIPNEKAWNASLVQQIFSPGDAAAILKTPLFHAVDDDRRIWKLNRDGIYSVESSYRLCVDTLTDASQLNVVGDWRMLWNLQVPPKVKTFAWRACRGVLPTRNNLQMRGINCPGLCVFCEQELETSCHLLVQCSKSRSCLSEAGFWHIIGSHVDQVNSFADLFFRVCNLLDHQKRYQFVMILWSLWKARNQQLWLWENDVLNSPQVIMCARDVLKSWELAKRKHPDMLNGDAGRDHLRWVPPSIDFVKCNLDASFFEQLNRTGVGMCLRDHGGYFVQAKSCWLNHKLPVHVGEALGLLFVLQWVSELGFHNVVFEVNSKLAADEFHSTKENLSEFRVIVSKFVSTFFTNFSVRFSRRQANRVAHSLARASVFYASSCTFHIAPTCIEDIIMNELS